MSIESFVNSSKNLPPQQDVEPARKRVLFIIKNERNYFKFKRC